MKSFIAASALVAIASAAVPKGTIPGVTTYVGRNGDVPLIYNPTPYTDNVYDGVLYNATVIDGITYDNSNAWPCLTAADYESIIPACSLNCIKKSLDADNCDVDDFKCHCEAAESAIIDAAVVPCLTSGEDALCSGAEIGQLANFVHGSLCPYFIDAPYVPKHSECYPETTPSKPASTSSTKPSSTSSTKSSSTSSTKSSSTKSVYGGGVWATSTSSTKTTSSSSSSAAWGKPVTTSSSSSSAAWGKPVTTSSSSSSAAWGKPVESDCSEDPSWSVTYTTEVVDAFTTYCPEATTFWVGASSWVVTEATTITVDAITWTKPVTYTPTAWATYSTPAAWATYSTPAAPVYPVSSSSASWAAGAAKGTAAWSASPVQFTGAASNNKVAGVMAAAAAGAAALLI